MHPVKNNLITLKLTITKLPETHANLYKIHFSFFPTSHLELLFNLILQFRGIVALTLSKKLTQTIPLVSISKGP